MGETMPASDDFRIYRSADTVLIRTETGEVELTAEAADRLGATLAPKTEASSPQRHIAWTAERIAEFRRLYVDEGMGVAEIARRMGLSVSSIYAARQRFGIPARDQAIAAATSARMLALHAARRAANTRDAA